MPCVTVKSFWYCTADLLGGGGAAWPAKASWDVSKENESRMAATSLATLLIHRSSALRCSRRKIASRALMATTANTNTLHSANATHRIAGPIARLSVEIILASSALK